MLDKYQRRTVSTFQSQPVPDHERIGLRGQRDHAEERLTGCPLDSLASDDATHVLPRGKAVADGHGRILPIVALKKLVLHRLDRRQHRCWIGGRLAPLLSDEGEHVGRQTGIRQNR